MNYISFIFLLQFDLYYIAHFDFNDGEKVYPVFSVSLAFLYGKHKFLSMIISVLTSNIHVIDKG